jgi:hypothetical protein
MEDLKKDLLDQLCSIIRKLYSRRHGWSDPSQEFIAVVRERLSNEPNPADDEIESIKQSLGPGNSDEVLLNQVARSERTLAGFYYLSNKRYAHANSLTVLRHWNAVAEKMNALVRPGPEDYDAVLKGILNTRYELGLARHSRLIGDNPVTIYRDESKYEYKLRQHILRSHS